MDSLDYIITRRSVRKYTNQPVDLELIKKIVHAAIHAPSAHNSQPWHFLILDNEKKKMNLARRMAEQYKADLEKDGVNAEQIQKICEHSISKFTNPPVLIVACLTTEHMEKYSDHRKEAERLLMIQSVSAAIQNLLLAAHVEGLATCWYCAPLFCPSIVSECLSLPEHVEPQAFITLGYGKEHPITPRRRPLDEVLHGNTWSETF
ncbi:MAG: nitroreductase family protein [Candidatus Helarchaeota archaeon]